MSLSTILLWRFYIASNNQTYLGLHVKCPIFLSDFTQILIFSADFDKSIISNFTNVRPVGDELIHADGQMDGRTDRQTDMTKLIGAFREYENASRG
jgi:hypothetical protein